MTKARRLSVCLSFDFDAAGGEATYFMTGPGGAKSRGWWRVTSVDPPRSLEFTDGFANPDGTPTRIPRPPR